MSINDQHLRAGDGVSIETAGTLRFEAQADAEFLLFDVAFRSLKDPNQLNT